MNFNIITRFKFKEAFNGNALFQGVAEDNDYLKVLFEYSDRGTIYIYDDLQLGHSVFVDNTHGLGIDKVFTIKNKIHKDVFLWHIDGILYKKNTKCDCACITDNELSFIEFKTNAENQTDKAIIENFEKAKEQLLQTIQDFSNRCQTIGVDIRGFVDIDAYIVLNRSVPDGNAFQKGISAKFLFESDGIELLFTNSKTLQY